MKNKNKNKLTARQVASMEITEDCRKRKEGQNCLPYENDICESLGIVKPNFRRFNGGHNKKR